MAEAGLSLVEVMIALVISGIALTGAMGAVQIAGKYIRQADRNSKAFELAHSRLEVKRSVRWHFLLQDDLDDDGQLDTIMKDDGVAPDVMAGDGIYTAALERDGITVLWSVEVDRPGPLSSVGMAIIQAVASYDGSEGHKEIRVATFRANPAFVGPL